EEPNMMGDVGTPALLELLRQLPPARLVLGAEFKPVAAAVPFKHGGRSLDARRAEEREGHVAVRTIADGQVEAISTVRPGEEYQAATVERAVLRDGKHPQLSAQQIRRNHTR